MKLADLILVALLCRIDTIHPDTSLCHVKDISFIPLSHSRLIIDIAEAGGVVGDREENPKVFRNGSEYEFEIPSQKTLPPEDFGSTGFAYAIFINLHEITEAIKDTKLNPNQLIKAIIAHEMEDLLFALPSMASGEWRGKEDFYTMFGKSVGVHPYIRFSEINFDEIKSSEDLVAQELNEIIGHKKEFSKFYKCVVKGC